MIVLGRGRRASRSVRELSTARKGLGVKYLQFFPNNLRNGVKYACEWSDVRYNDTHEQHHHLQRLHQPSDLEPHVVDQQRRVRVQLLPGRVRAVRRGCHRGSGAEDRRRRTPVVRIEDPRRRQAGGCELGGSPRTPRRRFFGICAGFGLTDHLRLLYFTSQRFTSSGATT